MLDPSFLHARHQRPAARRRTPAAAAGAFVALTTLLSAGTADAQFTRVSVAQDASQPNHESFSDGLSANGRFVVFTSRAANLVPGDTNDNYDVFVRDLVANSTERVSVTSAGAQASSGLSSAGAISDDGTTVIFSSSSALVPEDVRECVVAGSNCIDLYAHDRTTHATTLLTRGPGGEPANGDTWTFQISADGRFVVFESAASNLVPDDTNGQPDIFLLDRTTDAITRVSVGPSGEQGSGASNAPAISADGAVVAFTSTSNLTNDPACATSPRCRGLFVLTRATNTLQRVASEPFNFSKETLALRLDGTGRTLVIRTSEPSPLSNFREVTSNISMFDLTNGSQRFLHDFRSLQGEPLPSGLAISRDGLVIAFGQQLGTTVFDRTTGSSESIALPVSIPSAISGDGRYLAISLDDLQGVAGDTNGHKDAFRYDLDTDGDHMLNWWENLYGLDPDDAADAAQDPDDDGLTNLQEYRTGGHPRGTHARHFAEGAANAFFETRLSILNPTETPAPVVVRLLGENGQVRSIPLLVAARSRRSLLIDALSYAPDSAFSTVVESDRPIVADRLIRFGEGAGAGSTLETGVEAAATTWHFAEGATGSGFSLYYLLSNPGDSDADVTVEYLRPHPAGVLSETVPVPAHARVTLDVASRFPELLNATMAAKLTSTQPIVAERAMYRSAPGAPFGAGHAGAGIVSPSPRWFLAEGATGFFDEFVLVSNPGAIGTSVRFSFLPATGTPFNVTREVPAHSRFTLDVKEFPALANTSVSVIAESVDATPIVVERVMWWPSGGVWYEASLSAGVTGTGTTWAVAEGEQSGTARTYVLVANTDPGRDGQAKITLIFENAPPREAILDVPRSGRATFDVGTLEDLPHRTFSLIVEGLDGLPIVVERSLYDNSGGVLFAAGATSVATNITPVQ